MKIISGGMRVFTLPLLLLTLSGYMVYGSSASIAHVMSIEEMKEKADVILVGGVESIIHCPADPDDVPSMHRKVQISVERYLKNPLNSSGVTLLLLGSTVGNTTLVVSDQPDFNVSDRVLLFLIDDVWFLEENPRGYFQLVNGNQGKIEITADTDLGEFGFPETEPVDLPRKHAEPLWYRFVVPFTMTSLLALMYWRRMIPR